MRVNLLVTGGSSEIESFLRSARPMLVPPIRSVTARRAVTFAGTGTLILRDVNELTRSGQRALFAWMNEPTHAGMQIISTASAPLFPSVVAGIFDPDLYYRLNTICLTLGS